MLYYATKRVYNQLWGVQAQSASIYSRQILFHFEERMDLVFFNLDPWIRDSHIQSILVVYVKV